MNRPNIIFSRTESDPNRDHPRWDNDRVREVVMAMILADQIDGRTIIDPIVEFNEGLVEPYTKIATNPENNIKFGVTYPTTD